MHHRNEQDEIVLASLLKRIDDTSSGDGGNTVENVDELSQELDSLSADQLETLLHAKGCLDLLSEMREGDTYVPDAEDFGDRSDSGEESQTLNSAERKALGRFRILKRLGKGGCGQVYLAEDPNLGREIALKVLLPESLGSYEVQTRFAREARAAAMLDHPGIVPVYEAGRVEDVPYISFAYCPGPTLEQWLGERTQRLGIREAAKIIRSIARAIGYAHSKGIVHRDLKPANLMVVDGKLPTVGDAGVQSRYVEGDEQSIADRIRVADFGLVKDVARADRLVEQTGFGSVIGTPAYMAPEQCGSKAEMGPHSDVFSLGAILYELLVGAPPHKRETYARTIKSLELDEPEAIRSQRAEVPRDLEAICLRCLAKQPSLRYQSAFELAEDLDNWLNHRQVVARAPSIQERLASWGKRNPTLATSLMIAIIGLTTGFGLATWGWYEAEQGRLLAAESAECANTAEAETRREKDNLEDTLQVLVGSLQSLSQRTELGELVSARAMFSETLEQTTAKFSNNPSQRLPMLGVLGDAFLGLGDYQNSRRCLTEASELATERLGPNDDLSIELLSKKADVELESGEWIEAERSYRELGERLGAGDPRYEKVHAKLAETQVLMGRAKSSSVLLAGRSAVFGSLARSVATESPVRGGVLQIFSVVGDYEKTIQSARESLQNATKRHGAEDPKTTARMQNLALALGPRDFEQAYRLQEKVVARTKEHFGEDSLQSSKTYSNLALILSSSSAPKHIREGIKALNTAKRISVGRLSASHPDRLRISHLRGIVLTSAGHYHAANDVLMPAYQLARERLGEVHPETNAMLRSLSRSLWFAKKSAEAVPLLRNAIDDLLKHSGESSDLLLETKQHLGNLLLAIGEEQEAYKLFQEAYTQRLQLSGAKHPSTVALGSSIARMDLDRANYADAQRGFELALEQAKCDMEFACSNEEKDEDQTVTFNHSLVSKEELEYRYAMVVMNIATCLVEQGQLAEAEQLIEELGFELRHPHDAIARSIRGVISMDAGDYKRAEELMMDARRQSEIHANHIPPYLRAHKRLIYKRLKRLYDAWGKTEQKAKAVVDLEKLDREFASIGFIPPPRERINLGVSSASAE